MRLDDLAPWLFGRTTGGIRWGLERTQELLAGVGNPHRRFRSLLIGGTNGKGSVAALCDAALRAGAGERGSGGGGGAVGLYTSPHLVSFTERIRVDGRPVNEDLLLACAERLRPAIERTGASFFEATTAIAFLCFAEAGVEVAVVEVGLGGRLDATNVLDPLATAITNVALEHQEYLGDTLERIAREKAGIFKAGVPALTAEAEPTLVAELRSCAARVGAPFRVLEEVVRLEEVEVGASGSSFRLHSDHWGSRSLEVPLVGAHQIRNALLALELLAVLPPGLRPAWEAVHGGFTSVRWPGRLQREQLGGTTWLFDVAHNPAGAAALAAAIGRLDLPRPIVAVIGILDDKNWREMLPLLLARVDGCILTTPPSAPPERRWDPEQVADWAGSTLDKTLRVIPDFAAALARVSTLAPHGTVLVTGSIHTVGDAMAELGMVPQG